MEYLEEMEAENYETLTGDAITFQEGVLSGLDTIHEDMMLLFCLVFMIYLVEVTKRMFRRFRN